VGVTAPTTPAASPSTAGSNEPQLLAPKLAVVQVGVRKDLRVARHLFRGEVTYTVRDPVSFETHAFGAGDYAILVAITDRRTLGETFDALVGEGVTSVDHREDFYKFVVALHRGGLLALPISDDRSLVQRFESRASSRRKARWLVAMYWKIPIWNPDGFLVRTLDYGSRMFTRSALVLWTLLMVAALVSLAGRAASLGTELPTLIAGEQVLSMWALLIGLKVVHEFGHAYACRTFGGVVPEMGLTLVMMTPCAYVDASSSWNFSRTRDRLIVCFGGVYFESWIAGIAAIVWAFTEASALHSLAFQTMVLASITTIGFNLNPLMRFDGYFIASDLLQIPNLRAQASALTLRWLKRVAVGIDPGGPAWSPAMNVTLVTYCVAAAIYKVSWVLGMCAVIAIKFFAIGMTLGLSYGGIALVRLIFSSTRYLLLDKETALVRGRAAIMAVLLLVVPAVVVSAPLPRNVTAVALLRRETEHVVNAEAAGFILAIPAASDAHVKLGAPLVELASLEVDAECDRARVESSAAKFVVEVARAGAPREQSIALEELDLAEARRGAAELNQKRLTVRSPVQGDIVRSLSESSRGQFVAEGTALATIATGGWTAIALVDQLELSQLQIREGTEIEMRGFRDPGRMIRGTVAAVAPTGDTAIDQDLDALTLIGGGDIAVSPMSGHADTARFLVSVALHEVLGDDLFHGERLALRLPAKRASLASSWYHAVLRFRERLAVAE